MTAPYFSHGHSNSVRPTFLKDDDIRMWFTHRLNIMSVLILKYNQPVVYRASGLIAFYNLPHTKMIKHEDDDPCRPFVERRTIYIHSFMKAKRKLMMAKVSRMSK